MSSHAKCSGDASDAKGVPWPSNVHRMSAASADAGRLFSSELHIKLVRQQEDQETPGSSAQGVGDSPQAQALNQQVSPGCPAASCESSARCPACCLHAWADLEAEVPLTAQALTSCSFCACNRRSSTSHSGTCNARMGHGPPGYRTELKLGCKSMRAGL